MSTNHNCPDPMTRDRNADLAKLARAVFQDRMSGKLTDYVMEGGDPLRLYLNGALGVNVRVNWMDVTDEELVTVRAWSRYCENLFDAVEAHVMERLA